MPTTSDLVRLRAKYKESEVFILAVYSGRSSEPAFQRHIKSERISYAAIYDPQNRAHEDFGVTEDGRRYAVTPTFLIGRDGKVIWEKAELRHWPKSVAAVERRIDEELKKSTGTIRVR